MPLAREEEELHESTSSSERRHGRPSRSSAGQRERRRSTSGSRERRLPPPPRQGQQIQSLLRRHRDGFVRDTTDGSAAASAGSQGRTGGSAAPTGPRRKVADDVGTGGSAASTGARRRAVDESGRRAAVTEAEQDPLSPVAESTWAYDAYHYAAGDVEDTEPDDELPQWYQGNAAYGPARGPYSHVRRQPASQVPTFDDTEIIHLLTQ